VTKHVLSGDEAGPTEIQAEAPVPSFGPNQFRKVVVAATVVTGAFLVIFDLGWIPGVTNQMGTAGEVLILGGAAYVFAMAPFGWFLMGRTIAREALRVTVSSAGISAVRADTSTLDVSWTEPSFEGELSGPKSSPDSSMSFRWGSRSGRAWAQVTRSGASLLLETARRNNLIVDAVTVGKPPREWTVTKIRARPPPLMGS
jgi:hypothetical protein